MQDDQMTSHLLLKAQLRTVHVRTALSGKLTRTWQKYVSTAKYIMIVRNNKLFYNIVKSLRSRVQYPIAARVWVSVPFRSTTANHHAATEIEISAGK
jgi:hypothetical protein